MSPSALRRHAITVEAFTTLQLTPDAAFAVEMKRAELARLRAARERIEVPVERRNGERRVTRDRRGAVRVVDTDGTLVIRPADPASSAWMEIGL